MDLTARQAQFADAALALLTREGMASVTFRTVAKEAGMSLGAVQKAFPSKDAMLLATLTRMRETASGPQLAEPGRPTLVAWLTDLTLMILPLDERSRAAQLQAGAFAERAAFDEAIADVLAAGDAEIVGPITALVGRAIAEGEVSAAVQPGVVARAWLALTAGFASQLLYAPRAADDVRADVEATLHALLPPQAG